MNRMLYDYRGQTAVVYSQRVKIYMEASKIALQMWVTYRMTNVEGVQSIRKMTWDSENNNLMYTVMQRYDSKYNLVVEEKRNTGVLR